MKLSTTLQKEIIDFLKSLPTLHDGESQRAFIYEAGLDNQLQEQIQFGCSSAKFASLLVLILLKYGKLADGHYAIETVLETAQNYVGQDKRIYCESLIQKLHSSTFKPEKNIQLAAFPSVVSLSFRYGIATVLMVASILLIIKFYPFIQTKLSLLIAPIDYPLQIAGNIYFIEDGVRKSGVSLAEVTIAGYPNIQVITDKFGNFRFELKNPQNVEDLELLALQCHLV